MRQFGGMTAAERDSCDVGTRPCSLPLVLLFHVLVNIIHCACAIIRQPNTKKICPINMQDALHGGMLIKFVKYLTFV